MEEFCGSVLWVSYRSNRLWRNSFYLIKYEHMFCGVELSSIMKISVDLQFFENSIARVGIFVNISELSFCDAKIFLI